MTKYASLLKGLEISEIYLSHVRINDSMRLESEFYTKSKNAFNSVTAEKILVYSQYGSSNELNELGVGVPTLRLNEFDLSFIGMPQKYTDIDSEVANKWLLKKDDVLICRTNGNPKLVGRAAIVPADCEFIFASYLFRIRPDKRKINSATVVAYMNGRFGRAEIEKYAMRGNQANFSPAKFRQIQIPLLGDELNHAVEDVTSRSYSLLSAANKAYTEASVALLKEFGLADYTPTDESVSIRSFSDFMVTKRLDAEYYQPKYDELMAKLDGFNMQSLGTLVDFYKSIEPGSEYYGDAGIPFVRIADLSEQGIDCSGVRIPNDVCKEVRRLQKNVILMSKDGSVGIAYKMDRDVDAVTSGAILHLTVKADNILPDYLTLVLNSLIVKLQAERDAGGSIIQHWKPSEIAEVRIPILPMQVQTKLADMVQRSFAARKESARLLDLAKLAVETAIEKGEKEGLKVFGVQYEL